MPARKKDAPAASGILGARLRAARAHRELSQLDLALRVGIYPSLVSKLENNAKTPRDIGTALLGRILVALNPPGTLDKVTADYLIGLDEKITRRF